MNFIRIVWAHLATRRRELIVIIVTIAFFEVVKLINPFLFSRIIDALVTTHGGAITKILKLVACMVIVDGTILAIDLVTDRRVLRFLYGVEYETACMSATKVLELPLGYHEREQAGNTVSRIDRGTDKLMELIFDTTWQGIPTLLQVIVTIIAMVCTNARIAIVFAVFIPPFLWVSVQQQRYVHKFRKERYQAYEDASGHIGETIWNILTVQSFGNEHSRKNQHRTIRDAIVTNGRKQYESETWFGLRRTLILNTGRTTVLLAAVWETWSGNASIGSVVLFLTLSEKAYISLSNFSHLFSRIANSYEAVSRLGVFLAEKSDIVDSPNAVTPSLRGGITFEDVGFTYNGTSAMTLNGISLTITPGETIAFAGPSGGGKSTIVKLLFRHYDVTSGRVLLDGHDVRSLSREGFRQQLGYVPQEGQLFSGTVAENIRFGKADATDAEVRAAAELAGAAEFIATLPKQYETVIGEQGVKLSGGQRQRICIARAVVRKPKILVFDEATSALDVESEHVIQDALRKLQGTTTIILIVHRLSTIRHADRILVVEDGRIVEEGSHAQLLHENGLYHRLVQLQATGAHASA